MSANPIPLIAFWCPCKHNEYKLMFWVDVKHDLKVSEILEHDLLQDQHDFFEEAFHLDKLMDRLYPMI